MKFSKMLALLAAAAISLGAGAAQATQFTITVPVRVSNLPPNVDGMLLACWIYANEPRLGGRNVGIGRQRVNISGGAYSGNAILAFDATPGQDPGAATHYECAGSFTGTESGATVHYFADVVGASQFPLASGAALKLKTGVLPIPR